MNKKKLTYLILSVFLAQGLLTACVPSTHKQKVASGDKHEVEGILHSAGLSVDSVEDAILKAESAEKSGNVDLAQLYYVQAYELEPNNSQLLQKMADLYIHLRKYDLAEVSFKLILKQQPNDLKTIEQYGLLLIRLRHYPEAKENLGRVIAKQQSWHAYNGLGIIASLQGEPLKAIDFFKKANSLYPNSPELLNNVGYAFYTADKLDEAASYYAKALQINPGFKKAIYNYALLQARLSNYEESYIAFTKVTAPAEASNNIGYIAMMNGNYSVANKYLKEAINLSPEFYKKANDNLARLELLEKQ